jgi:hypothetical protein
MHTCKFTLLDIQIRTSLSQKDFNQEVYMATYIYIYMHIYTYIHTHVYIYMYIYEHIYVHLLLVVRS